MIIYNTLSWHRTYDGNIWRCLWRHSGKKTTLLWRRFNILCRLGL